MPSARRRSSDKTQRFLGAFAFEIADRAVAAAAVLEHLGKCLVSDHRSWQRFARRVWAGGVAASSGELPLDEPSDRTTCSVARSWHARMGARAAAATAVRSPARARIPRPGVASREPRRDGSAVRGGGTSRLWRRRGRQTALSRGCEAARHRRAVFQHLAHRAARCLRGEPRVRYRSRPRRLRGRGSACAASALDGRRGDAEGGRCRPQARGRRRSRRGAQAFAAGRRRVSPGAARPRARASSPAWRRAPDRTRSRFSGSQASLRERGRDGTRGAGAAQHAVPPAHPWPAQADPRTDARVPDRGVRRRGDCCASSGTPAG